MIRKAITRAYQILEERNWDTIFWAVDLHGTCIKSNYDNSRFEFVCEPCVDTLNFLQTLPETKLIAWSSCFDEDFAKVRELFAENNIHFDFFNENPLVSNTQTGNFDSKFYFSILLDDKAGFDPHEDWEKIMQHVGEIRNNFLRSGPLKHVYI